jgi:DNA-directed RNA polymerase beta' subunit
VKTVLFGINPSICENYGADFDGDQMNVIVLKCTASQAQCYICSNVERMFIFNAKQQVHRTEKFKMQLLEHQELTRNSTLMSWFHSNAFPR